MTAYEIIFGIFMAAFVLEGYKASREHGLDGKARITPPRGRRRNLLRHVLECTFPTSVVSPRVTERY
jgi:hypothetical protein